MFDLPDLTAKTEREDVYVVELVMRDEHSVELAMRMDMHGTQMVEPRIDLA